MKERPIIFSTDMVKAILDSRKTQTRRLVKTFQHEYPWGVAESIMDEDGLPCYVDKGNIEHLCPYGQPGDRLWVRETWWDFGFFAEHLNGDWVGLLPDMTGIRPKYYADVDRIPISPIPHKPHFVWRKRPSIHMPRWASRLTLEITDVRVERLQEISRNDCLAEGVPFQDYKQDYKWAFGKLWDSLKAKRGYGWETNPWCWCISFMPIMPCGKT